MRKNLRKFLRRVKCYFGKHDWYYSGRNVVEKTNQDGFYRFCPYCTKKQERIIFDFGRIMIWIKSTDDLNSEELRVSNLNKLDI